MATQVLLSGKYVMLVACGEGKQLKHCVLFDVHCLHGFVQ